MVSRRGDGGMGWDGMGWMGCTKGRGAGAYIT